MCYVETIFDMVQLFNSLIRNLIMKVLLIYCWMLTSLHKNSVEVSVPAACCTLSVTEVSLGKQQTLFSLPSPCSLNYRVKEFWRHEQIACNVSLHPSKVYSEQILYQLKQRDKNVIIVLCEVSWMKAGLPR